MWVALTGRNRYSGTSRYPYPEADAYLPCPWSHYGSTGSIPCLNYNNNVLPSYEVMSKYSHDNKPSSLATSSQPYNAGIRSSDFGTSYINFRATSSGPVDPHIPIRNQEIPEYTSDLSGTGGRGDYSAYESHIGGVYGYEEKGLALSPSEVDQGYSSLSRSHKDDKLSSYHDYMKEPYSQDQQQLDHGFRSRPRQGVGREEGFHLMKASYRGQRGYHDDEEDTPTSPLSSLGSRDGDRESLAELKRRYGGVKMEEEEGQRSQGQRGRAATVQTEEPHPKSANLRRYHSDKTPEKKTFSQQEADEGDTMPTWRKRRLEREQRRKEFLSMSETKAQEREKLKATELADSEDSEAGQEAMRQRFRDRVKKRQQKLQEERESLLRERQLEREREQKSDRTVPGGDDGGDMGTLGAREGESITDKTRHLTAEDMKTILLKRDSPLLRSRYAEAKRKKDQEKDLSRDELPVEKPEDKQPEPKSRSSALSRSRPLSTGDGEHYRKKVQEAHHGEPKVSAKTSDSKDSVTSPKQSPNVAPTSTPSQMQRQPKHTDHRKGVKTVEKSSQPPPKISQTLSQKVEEETTPSSAAGGQPSAHVLKTEEQEMGKAQRGKMKSKYLEAVGEDDPSSAAILSRMGVSYGRPHEKQATQSKETSVKVESQNKQDERSKKVMQPSSERQSGTMNKTVVKPETTSHSQMMATRGGQLGSVQDSQQQQSVPRSQDNSRRSSVESMNSDHSSSSSQRLGRSQVAKRYSDALETGDNQEQFKGFKLFDIKNAQKKQEGVTEKKDSQESKVRRVQSAKVNKQEKLIREEVKEAVENVPVIRRSQSAKSKSQAVSNTDQDGESSVQYTKPGQRSVASDFLENTDLRNLEASHIKSGTLAARFAESLSAISAEKAEEEHQKKKQLEEYFKDAPQPSGKRTPKAYSGSKTSGLPTQHSLEEKPQEEPVQKPKEKTPKAAQRKKTYVKAKNTDVSSLISAVKDTKENETEKGEMAPANVSQEEKPTEQSRLERINSYKEERRKQLAVLAATFSGEDQGSDKEKLDILPSLFHVASQSESTKGITRSSSLREDSPAKTSSPGVSARSQSFREGQGQGQGQGRQHSPSPEKVVSTDSLPVSDKFSKFREQFGTVKDPIIMKTFSTQKPSSKTDIQKESKKDSTKTTKTKSTTEVSKEEGIEKGGDKPQQRKRRQLPTPPATDAVGQSPVVQSHVAVEPQTRDVYSKQTDVTKYSQRAEESTQTQQAIVPKQKPEFKTKEEVPTGVAKQSEQKKTSQKRPTSLEMSSKKDKKEGTEKTKSEHKEVSSSNTTVQKQKSKVSSASATATAAVSASDAAPKMAVFVASKQVPTKSEPQKKETKTRPVNRQRQSPAKEATVKEPSPVPITPVVAKVFQPQQKATFTQIEPKVQSQEESPVIERPPSLLKESGKMFYQQLQDGQQVIQSQSVVKPLESSSVGVIQTSVQSQIHESPVLSKPLSQNINVEESPIVSRPVCSDMAPVVYDNKQGPVTNVPGQQIEHGPLSPPPVSTIQISVSQPAPQKPMSRLAQKVEMNKLARAEATLRAAIQDTPPCEEIEKEVPERKVLVSARDVVRPEKEARMIMAPTGHVTAFPSAQKIAVQQRVEPSQLPCEEVQDISTETNKTPQQVLISSQHSDGKTRAAYAKAVVSEPEAVSVISESVVPPGGKGVLRQHSADRLKPTLDDRTKEASPALSSGSESSSKRLSGDFSSIRVSGEFDMAHIIEKLSSRPEEPPKASQTQGSLIPETVPSVSETRAKVADLLQPLDKRREKASSEERYSDDGLKQKLDLIRRQKYAARKSEFLSAAGFDKSKSTSDSDEQPNIPKELSPLIQEQMAKIQEQIPHLHKPKHQDSQSEEQVDEFSAHAPTIIHRKTSDPARGKEQQHVLYAAQNFPPPQQKSELVSQPPEQYLQPVRSKSLRADMRRKSAEVARILNKSPETNLDDLLLENMDYLSDHDLVQKAAEKAGKKPSEKGKTKRSLRKKMMRRSHSDSSGMTEIALSKRAAVEEMQMSGRMFVATTSRGDYSTTLEADRAAVDSSLDSSSDAQTTQRFVHSQTKHYGARGVLETEDSVKGLDSFVHSHSAKGGNLVPEVLSQDSESSSSLSGRGSERRRRIDKSSVRKSSLNMGSVDEDGERNQGRQIQSESHTSSQPESTSDLLTLHGTSSHSANSKNHAQDKNTNSVLDKILPSKFPIPASRVSSAISKFSSEESEKSQGEGCRRKPDDGTLKKITRRNDFSSLLQKFSASDPSGSETDQPSPRPRLSLRRQEACALSSSSDSDTRRTPERTQSLRLGKSPTPERELVSPVQRAGSFKSAFMKRRYSPEPTNRVPLSDSNPPSQEQSVTAPKSGSVMVSITSEDSTGLSSVVHHDDLSKSVTSATPQQQEPSSRSQPNKREVTETNQMSKDSKTHGGIYHCSTSDKPTSELSAVLNKRQDIVREQQERGMEAERARIVDKTVEKESVSHFAAENDEVLIDTEVASMLNARRKETYAHLAHELKLETPQTKVQPEVKGHQPDVVSSVTQNKSQIPTDRPDVISHQASSKRVPESKGMNQSSTEKKFTMSDLDASLAVLEKAAKGMDEANTDECFDSSLSSVHLNSREEMKEFLGHFQPEKPVDVCAPRERTSSSSSQSDNPVAKVKAKIARRHSSSSKSQEKLRKSPSPEPSTRPAPQTVLSPLKDRLASPVGKSCSSVKRTQSLNTAERPRGILKRTPSLKHSGVIVDSELASILEQRRKQEGNDSEEEEVKTFDPKKDIEETLKREKLHHQQSVSSEGPKEEGEEEKEEDNNGVSSLSMSERIYHMQAKLEEITSSPVTPKNKSGTGTPGSLRRSELSLFSQSSFDSVPSSLCGEQLFEKLSNLTTHGPSISERKQQFQQGKKEGWRRRTAPVTTEEIHEADNLESVRKLRADVAKKTSKNVFEQINAQQSKYHGRKTEYPHSYAISLRKSQKRRRNRCNSVPTTSAELGAIPEGQIAIAMAALRAKNVGHKDSKADSGILSGSDSETNLDADGLRRLSMDFDVGEDDPARMSVSAKASLFAKQIQEKEKSKVDRPKNSASGAKRYIDRKKRERSRTQPVTEDEVKTAAEFADAEEQEGEGTQSQQEVDNSSDVQPSKNIPPAVTSKPERSSSMDEEGDEQGEKDELSRRSLADKVKLFSNLKKEEEKKKPSAPVVRRKNRKLTSRFNTQPITYEEVEKAAEYRISPLAMSMVKPPDPEILAGLPLCAQRDIMAKHAEASLSQPSSRASSRPGSMMDLSGSASEQGRSKPGSTADLNSDLKSSDGHKGILKHDHPTHDADIKSILKADGEKSDHSEPKGILKGEITKKKDSEPKGILKQGESESEHSDTDHRSILKHSDDSAHGVVSPVASDTDTKSILKHQESEERLLKTAEQKAAIRKDLALCLGKRPTEPRGILKRETSYETPSNEPEKTSLKKPHQPAGLMSELKGILKRDSLDEPSESEDGDLSEHKDEAEKVKATDGAEKVKAVDESHAQEEVQGQDESADSEEPSTPRRRRERYLTQPADISSPNKSPETPRRIRYTGRNKTQPITPEEKREAESNDVTANSSIKDRLSALQKSGEEGWRKRVSKNLDLDSRRSPSPSAEDVTVRLREKRAVSPALPRPSSIADRLSQLDTAQVGWKGRVGDKDVKKFTIAHKMGGQVEESPLVSKLKRRQRRTGSESESGSELSSPSTPSKEWTKIPIPTELVTDTEAAKPKPAEAPVDDEEEDKGPVKVAVPTQDISSLESFFTSRTMEEITSEKFDVDITTFDEIFIEANDILETRKKIKPKRRHNTKGRNPLRTINVEVKAEYEEVKVGYADQELRRVKTAQIAKDAGFAQEALAGLASKENFAKVALRKTGDQTNVGTSRLEPYKDLMLIHIKGRRKIQTRLVEPSAKSVNSGDCYVLVTPDKVISWIGEYSNVIEKAKAADVATVIFQKKDLGCKSATGVGTVEEARQHLGTGKHFWAALGGKKQVSPAGPAEEDELYENHVVETNMVYRLEDGTLKPFTEYWGNTPKYEMLKKDAVLVFDFGSELYLWQGKSVKPEHRKTGLKLARQLYEKGYNYEQCDINPLCPLNCEGEGSLPMLAPSRPEWALFGKVNQNMETVLFREKFSDWPDTSRLIKVKSQTDLTQKTDAVEMKPYDAKLMIPVDTSPVTLVLEGSNVGRGNTWSEDMQGFIKEQEIHTLATTVWHVLEYDHYKVPEQSYGQFHEGDTYVVRWQYMITSKGMKDIKGTASTKKSLVGRERCAYFFWQGKASTVNEKGASALMTVELDEERGPQVRVDEGKELPCFLNLFDLMIIHIGKREEESTNTQGPWRCYCVRNDYENESCLLEIAAGAQCLRSRSSFIFLNVITSLVYIWHGAKSPEHIRKMAANSVEKLKVKCPLEVGLEEAAKITSIEMEEGKERADFWRLLEAEPNDRSLYHSLLKDPLSYDYTLRLFHMTSVSGAMEVHEILNPSRTPDLVTSFPVLQSDLYKASQPALFLVDNQHVVYLWHGWWPEGDQEVENVTTGSALSRFNTDRKCAIETTLQYCTEKNSDNPPEAIAVYAGLEPLEFINLFPFWEVHTPAKDSNLKEGKRDRDSTPVRELRDKVNQAHYSFDELQERPLPEGVDPLKLESYLTDREFQEILEMTKEEFYALPQWRQHNLKQQVDLY